MPSRTATLPCFNVHALISPELTASYSNTMYKKIFKTIYDALSHEDCRWVIVEKYGEPGFWGIDLWASKSITLFPYIEPVFVEGGPYKTVTQAIGATVLC